MKELTIDEVKKIQLSILKRVTHFCEENDLRYYLCAGTMLGAVRHKGYIPWDDDIDIMMPRPDYEKLLMKFKVDNLQLHHYNTTDHYYYPFAKIGAEHTRLKETLSTQASTMGINIDVFPLDGYPASEEEIQQHLTKIKELKKRLYSKISVVNNRLAWYKKMYIKAVAYLINGKRTAQKIDEIAKEFDFSSSPNAGIAVWGYEEREVCPKKVFTSGREIEFEGSFFNGPKDYDTYLTRVYGNYMQLPPKDQRVSHHDFKAWIINNYNLDQLIAETAVD